MLARIAGIGRPLAAHVGPSTLPGLLGATDGRFVSGRHMEIRTLAVAGLTPEVRDALISGAWETSSLHSAIVLHCLKGAATRVPVEGTAFGNRTAHVMVEMIAIWEPDSAPRAHGAWLRGLSSALAAHAMPGG